MTSRQATSQIVIAARLLAEHRAAKIAAWDAHGRAIPSDAFAYWPACTVIPPLGDLVGVFRKRHGTVTVTCPPAADPQEKAPPFTRPRTMHGTTRLSPRA
jgi:hypothetical protein